MYFVTLSKYFGEIHIIQVSTVVINLGTSVSQFVDNYSNMYILSSIVCACVCMYGLLVNLCRVCREQWIRAKYERREFVLEATDEERPYTIGEC